VFGVPPLGGSPGRLKTKLQTFSASRETTTATTPFFATSFRKSCPSNWSPLIAKNRSPSYACRESVQTQSANVRGEPFNSSPPQAGTIKAKVRVSTFHCKDASTAESICRAATARGDSARPSGETPRSGLGCPAAEFGTRSGRRRPAVPFASWLTAATNMRCEMMLRALMVFLSCWAAGPARI